jgi:LuxR family maltose regulon positive regulatory protein
MWARRALDLLPTDEHERRAAPAALLALAAWTIGDLDGAAQALVDALAHGQLLDDSRFAISATYVLGEILREQGRFDAAQLAYDRALGSPGFATDELLANTANLYVGMAELHLRRNDLEAAERDLERSRELGEIANPPHWRHRWLVARAGLLRAQGDLTLALEVLDEAARCYLRGPVPDVRPVAAHKVRVHIQMNELRLAEAVLSSLGVTLDDPVSYMREYSHLTLAGLVVAQRRAGGSDRRRVALFKHLDRLLQAAAEQARVASQVEILALKALAYDAFGDRPQAFAPLKQALELAEPLGYVQVFLVEGEPMRELLRALTVAGAPGGLLGQLWNGFDQFVPDGTGRAGPGDLIERLTERELEVLRLVAAGLRNRDIADELFISLSTVKRHIANAYGKLEVSSRTEAIARANQLGLI